MNQSNLFRHLEKVGPGILFPTTAEMIHFGDLYRLGVHPLSNRVYSFSVTCSLKGRPWKRIFVLRVCRTRVESTWLAEHVVLKTLRAQGAPVPMVYSVETEKETIGHPFFVMEKVNGVSASHLLRNERDSLQTVEIIAKTLASVHRVNANLFSQDKRMNHQFAQQKLSNIEKLVNIEYVANLSPFLRANYLRVIRKLREEAPRDFTPTILHGDFGPDHVFITDNGPVIIDWECADLGDPAYDVGWAYHIMLLEGQSMIDHRFVPSHGQKTLSSDLGEHFVRCYENCHGKLDNLSFYKNLAAIRLLTIFDPYLRPNLYSSLRNVMYMGVRETISRTFNIRSDTRSFHNYCTRFLRKGGYLA